jgi:hypothetical protein
MLLSRVGSKPGSCPDHNELQPEHPAHSSVHLVMAANIEQQDFVLGDLQRVSWSIRIWGELWAEVDYRSERTHGFLRT